jgi:hypothetical protein
MASRGFLHGEVEDYGQITNTCISSLFLMMPQDSSDIAFVKRRSIVNNNAHVFVTD